ncbi:MAG: ParB/RepB/Spo0J family partition protein [Oscillospiraceae bacterium]|nr:ParB/RepB/Spo0J family partition protein [Oscillospiraceae bacterium]
MKLNDNEIKKGGSILLIPVDNIYSNPFQPRRIFNELRLNELAQSIKSNGIIQPLIVRKSSDKYELISGERRLRAAKMVGLSTVPCVLMAACDEKSELFSLIENIQRENLYYFEQTESISSIINNFNVDNDSFSKLLGKNEEVVLDALKFDVLSDDIKSDIILNSIPESVILMLLEINDEIIIKELLEYIIVNSLNEFDSLVYINSFLNSKTKKITKVSKLKDIKIFINKINHAVDTMCRAGIKAKYSETETDGFYEFLVKIPKMTTSPVNCGNYSCDVV